MNNHLFGIKRLFLHPMTFYHDRASHSCTSASFQLSSVTIYVRIRTNMKGQMRQNVISCTSPSEEIVNISKEVNRHIWLDVAREVYHKMFQMWIHEVETYIWENWKPILGKYINLRIQHYIMLTTLLGTKVLMYEPFKNVLWTWTWMGDDKSQNCMDKNSYFHWTWTNMIFIIHL